MRYCRYVGTSGGFVIIQDIRTNEVDRSKTMAGITLDAASGAIKFTNMLLHIDGFHKELELKDENFEKAMLKHISGELIGTSIALELTNDTSSNYEAYENLDTTILYGCIHYIVKGFKTKRLYLVGYKGDASANFCVQRDAFANFCMQRAIYDIEVSDETAIKDNVCIKNMNLEGDTLNILGSLMIKTDATLTYSKINIDGWLGSDPSESRGSIYIETDDLMIDMHYNTKLIEHYIRFFHEWLINVHRNIIVKHVKLDLEAAYILLGNFKEVLRNYSGTIIKNEAHTTLMDSLLIAIIYSDDLQIDDETERYVIESNIKYMNKLIKSGLVKKYRDTQVLRLYEASKQLIKSKHNLDSLDEVYEQYKKESEHLALKQSKD